MRIMRNIDEILNDMRSIVKPFIAKMLREANFEGQGSSDEVEFTREFEAVLILAEKGFRGCEHWDANNKTCRRSEVPSNEWIPVKDRLPVCEEKVLVQAIRTFKGGDTMTIITTGMYEDGTISECDSRWWWEDVDYEKWDDDNDCMIIPKGWWEDKSYTPDGAINYQIDDKVVAWMPLPSPYKGE